MEIQNNSAGQTTNVVLFEDDGVNQLFPITTGRPAYAISCAGYRLIDWLVGLEGHLCGRVRSYLEMIQIYDFPSVHSELDESLETTLLVNARMVPTPANFEKLKTFQDRQRVRDRSVVAVQGSSVAVAIVPTSRLIGRSHDQQIQWINSLAFDRLDDRELMESDLVLFEYPHEVIDQNTKCFQGNLQHRIDHGQYQCREQGVYTGSGVQVGKHVVFDVENGPIVIDEGVTLGHFSMLRGPVYVGPNSRISEYAAIKDEVSISHTCKIGGEVEATVIEPYSNKQHHGFLGHSYLGSWINLGAGTCNSDLKNTYGHVNAEYGGRKVATGMQFLGCVMGDYAKTAINTSIFTGRLIGTASMVYGFATTNVPSFVNYARSFGELGALPPEVIVSTQRRMLARRNVEQRPCDIQLIHDMYRVTQSERPAGLSNDPPSL